MELGTRLAIIGGSRAYDLLGGEGLPEGPLAPVETPFGESSPMGRLRVGGHEVLFVSRHGLGGYRIGAPFVNYRANTYALKDAGAERIVAWSGPGCIDPAFEPGQYVIPDDLIDETRGRGASFYEGTGLGLLRQSPVFCPEVASVLLEAASGGARVGESRALRLGIPMRKRSGQPVAHGGGTYVCTQGPRLETPAEIRKYALAGGQLVGMTLAPEVFLARELEMCYAAICYVTNYAEGVREAEHEAEKLFQGLAGEEDAAKAEEAVRRLPGVIERAVRALADVPRRCACGDAMKRYKLQGDIGEDWREWVKPPS